MDTLIELILTTSYTKKQALRRLNSFRDFANFILFSGVDKLPINELIVKFSNEKASSEDDIVWLSKLDQNIFKDIKPENLKDITTKIEQEIYKTKTIILYLPFVLPEDPSHSLIPVGINQPSVNDQIEAVSAIGDWIKKNVSNKSLFETKFDPNLIGGSALSLNGIYKDYSLKTKLEENKGAILKSLVDLKK